VLPTDGPRFTGPWFTRRPHTLLALALDDALALDEMEATLRLREPMSNVAGLAWIPSKVPTL
jgi:hypothetical protein